jgi:maltooligosyltrehalose trehalohydrolase
MAAHVRAQIGPNRHVHLMLENEHNDAAHLRGEFDAQWNDDAHNALHVLLTGECESYYANYADAPAEKLARCLAEGFAYQGEPSPSHDGAPRGTPSADLPPTAFILFLQNHDQIGNRAFGERLTQLADPQALRAAILLQLLCPQIPLLFMGEEWGCRSPFLFFTDFHDELAAAVRDGRRREFARFSAFADDDARAAIPDPNAESTFLRSIPERTAAPAERDCRAWYADLLTLRRAQIVPRLAGIVSLGAVAYGHAAVAAAWRCSDGAVLRIAANFGADDCAVPAQTGEPLCESARGASAAAASGTLPARSACAFIDGGEAAA